MTAIDHNLRSEKPKRVRLRKHCTVCGYRTDRKDLNDPVCPKCGQASKPMKSLAGGGTGWAGKVRGGVYVSESFFNQVLAVAHAEGVPWAEACRRLMKVGLMAREAGMWPTEFPKS